MVQLICTGSNPAKYSCTQKTCSFYSLLCCDKECVCHRLMHKGHEMLPLHRIQKELHRQTYSMEARDRRERDGITIYRDIEQQVRDTQEVMDRFKTLSQEWLKIPRLREEIRRSTQTLRLILNEQTSAISQEQLERLFVPQKILNCIDSMGKEWVRGPTKQLHEELRNLRERCQGMNYSLEADVQAMTRLNSELNIQGSLKANRDRLSKLDKSSIQTLIVYTNKKKLSRANQQKQSFSNEEVDQLKQGLVKIKEMSVILKGPEVPDTLRQVLNSACNLKQLTICQERMREAFMLRERPIECAPFLSRRYLARLFQTVLPAASSLKKLTLNGFHSIQMDDSSVDQLTRCIPQVEDLTISINKLSSKGFKYIFQRLPNLTILNLEGRVCLLKSDLEKLTTWARKLKQLEVSRCLQDRASAIKAVRQLSIKGLRLPRQHLFVRNMQRHRERYEYRDRDRRQGGRY